MAPESRRDIVSALFEFEWIKMRTVIDFRVDMYTLELLGLISADLIRLRENPVGVIDLTNEDSSRDDEEL